MGTAASRRPGRRYRGRDAVLSRGPGKWQRAILADLEVQPEGVILGYILDPGTGDVPTCAGYSARQRAAKKKYGKKWDRDPERDPEREKKIPIETQDRRETVGGTRRSRSPHRPPPADRMGGGVAVTLSLPAWEKHAFLRRSPTNWCASTRSPEGYGSLSWRWGGLHSDPAGRAGRLAGSLRHYILCFEPDNIAIIALIPLTH